MKLGTQRTPTLSRSSLISLPLALLSPQLRSTMQAGALPWNLPHKPFLSPLGTSRLTSPDFCSDLPSLQMCSATLPSPRAPLLHLRHPTGCLPRLSLLPSFGSNLYPSHGLLPAPLLWSPNFLLHPVVVRLRLTFLGGCQLFEDKLARRRLDNQMASRCWL